MAGIPMTTFSTRARSSRSRTERGRQLIAAITAFVSRQIIPQRTRAGAAWRLLGAPFRQEVRAAQPIDLRENRFDVPDVALDRLQQHATPHSAHAHLGAGHPKFLRQPHGLASSMPENLGYSRVGHGSLY